MANHLIIGLGGTGGSILRELRKRIYEEYGSNTPEGNILLDYIYLDSDTNDLNDNDNKWNYLGNSVALSPANLLNIHGMGAGVLGNLNSFPGLKSFISPEDLELLHDRQVSDIISTGIGGQRRRFGRMLFANNLANAPKKNQFPDVFVKKLQSLQRQGNSEVTIHICAGLAGGTGSGTLIDVITQIQKKVEGEVGVGGKSPYPIFLYLYVPEIIVGGKKDAGFYHANGYAALRELNAMAIGKYRPLDVSPDNIDFSGMPWRLPQSVGEPFDKAYLFTSTNSDGRILPVGSKLSAAVGDFIFQKMMGTSSAMSKLVNSENNGCQPDTNEDGLPIHSRNFMTFGIKRVVYPESEIKGYICYNTNMSVLKHLIYNNWVDRAGFQIASDEESAGLGLDSEIKTEKGRNIFQISDLHLTLQSEIKGFEDTSDWSDFTTYWNRINAYMAKKTLENNPDNHLWKNSYVQMMDVTFTNNFRNVGVKNFFDTQSRPENVKRFARVLCNHIETVLFNEWLTGVHGEGKPQSLQKVKMILEVIQADCIERIPVFTKLIDSSNRALAQQILPELKRAENVLDDTGWLSHALFDTKKKHFNEYSTAKTKEYIIRTRLASYEFARKLLEELSHQLVDKINGLQNLINLFKTANNRLEAASTFIITKPTENANEVSLVEKVFDASSMAQSTEDYVLKDAALQNEIGAAVKNKIRDLSDTTGKGRSFGALYTSLGGTATATYTPTEETEKTDALISFLQDVTFDKVSQKLQKIAEEEPDNQFLSVNVLKKIQQEYPDDKALENYLKELVASASSFAMLATDTGAKQGNSNSQSHDQFIQLCIPAYEDNDYRNKFIKIFADVAGWDADYKDYVTENSRTNELVIITATPNIPVRMLANVKTLRQKYLNLTSAAANNNSELNRMLLHTESLPEASFPDLFAEDPAIRQRRFRIYTMILHTDPDALKKRQNVEKGGLEENAIILGSGLKRTTVFVGNDMEATARMMEEGNAQKLRATVMKYVDDVILPKYVQNTQRAEFRESIENKVVEEILENRCNNNETDPLFKLYCQAAEEGFENKLKDQ